MKKLLITLSLFLFVTTFENTFTMPRHTEGSHTEGSLTNVTNQGLSYGNNYYGTNLANSQAMGRGGRGIASNSKRNCCKKQCNPCNSCASPCASSCSAGAGSSCSTRIPQSVNGGGDYRSAHLWSSNNVRGIASVQSSVMSASPQILSRANDAFMNVARDRTNSVVSMNKLYYDMRNAPGGEELKDQISALIKSSRGLFYNGRVHNKKFEKSWKIYQDLVSNAGPSFLQNPPAGLDVYRNFFQEFSMNSKLHF